MSIQQLFTTPIKIISLPNYEEVNRICGFAMSGNFKENFFENLNKEDISKTVKVFNDEVKLFVKESINQDVDFYIKKSWFSYHKKLEWNTPHGHPSNSVIGVYYIKTNKTSGDLILHDPRGATVFSQIWDENQKCFNRTYVRISPKVGDLILFPAYTVHSVEPNLSDETRISLAMNFMYKDFTQYIPDKSNKI
jgi:uncharacterized protein (TIGR02466 family)